jgi:phosphate transport system ATP-binding protein
MSTPERIEASQNGEHENQRSVIKIEKLSVYYGEKLAVHDITLPIFERKITALIGPSGCGKSTLLRSMNRMNELIRDNRTEGKVVYQEKNIYDTDVDPVEVRRGIGMVFQKPNPFPKSIFENVAYGPRLLGVNKKETLKEIVEISLKQAYLWDEVRGDLNKSGLALSGGQQQRLCIARTLAIEPKVILMDEPCSALDPIATKKIEELMIDLSERYTIVIVTHNLPQALRVSNFTGFLNIRKADEGMHEKRWGELVEFNATEKIFSNPQNQETADYISGRFG